LTAREAAGLVQPPLLARQHKLARPFGGRGQDGKARGEDWRRNRSGLRAVRSRAFCTRAERCVL